MSPSLYEKAADAYPTDDEYRICTSYPFHRGVIRTESIYLRRADYLACALDQLLLSHATVRAVIDIVDQIEERLPDVMAIWEYCSRKHYFDEKMPWVKEIGAKFRALLERREVQMESRVTDEMW